MQFNKQLIHKIDLLHYDKIMKIINDNFSEKIVNCLQKNINNFKKHMFVYWTTIDSVITSIIIAHEHEYINLINIHIVVTIPEFRRMHHASKLFDYMFQCKCNYTCGVEYYLDAFINVSSFYNHLGFHSISQDDEFDYMKLVINYEFHDGNIIMIKS